MTFATNAIGYGDKFVASGDFNGDGRLDLITANLDTSSVSLLRGNGDATFAAPSHFSTSYATRALAVRDFNGDGKPDLAVANNNSSSVGILLNQSLPVLEISPLPGSVRIAWPDWSYRWNPARTLPRASSGRRSPIHL